MQALHLEWHDWPVQIAIAVELHSFAFILLGPLYTFQSNFESNELGHIHTRHPGCRGWRIGFGDQVQTDRPAGYGAIGSVSGTIE